MTNGSELRRAALSLGGNLGEVAAAFRQALEKLEASGRTQVKAISRVWRTPPWGKTDQPDFLNMAALVETRLSPHELLALCLALETQGGRERVERWGPRTLDIDLILFEGETIESDALTLPHPRAHARAFVLVPLAEIAGCMTIGGRSISELAAQADRAGMTVDEAATALIAKIAKPALGRFALDRPLR